MQCDYRMTPAKSSIEVWRCGLEQGHDGWHRTLTDTLEQRSAIRDAYFIGLDKKALRGIEGKQLLLPAQQESIEAVIKRTKSGAINTQSTMGKTVALALAAGCELKVGSVWAAGADEPYSKSVWLVGAHHGLRFSVTGASVTVNGHPVPKEQLFIRLEELA